MLADVETAPITESLRATLGFLRTVTRAPDMLTAETVRPLLAKGLTRKHLDEALAVAWCFNVITRLADTFAFEVGPRGQFDAGAKMLLSRGYV